LFNGCIVLFLVGLRGWWFVFKMRSIFLAALFFIKRLSAFFGKKIFWGCGLKIIIGLWFGLYTLQSFFRSSKKDFRFYPAALQQKIFIHLLLCNGLTKVSGRHETLR
jgi:Na+/melibiose symporter-like transporter